MPISKTVPGTALVALALLGLAALAMWPALGAGFLQDDWDFMASSAHLPTPLPYFLENYSRGYFYRPNGMLVWWLMNRAAGLDPAWHYALQIVVHAGCALAAHRLMRRLGASFVAAAMASAVFVVHPGAVATSLWLSNRFDLLSALGLLLALALLFGRNPARPAALAGLAACTWLAVGAKEIGLLMVPLAALAFWLRPDLVRRDRAAGAVAVLLPILGWFLLRLHVLGKDVITDQRDPGLLLDQFVAGVGLWLHYLPTALALDAPRWLGWMVLVALLGTGLAALRHGRMDPRARRALLGLALLLLPPLLQWPITHFTLAMPDALSISVSLRFYFLALLGATLLLSIPLDALAQRPAHAPVPPRVMAVVAAAVVLSLSLPLLHQARKRSHSWTANTANPESLRMEAALVRRFEASAGGAGCKLAFFGANSINLPGFADHVVKAHLPRGHLAVDSLVITDPMPWSAIVGPAGARPAALAPLDNRVTGTLEHEPAAVGPLFYVSLAFDPAALSDDAGCSPLSFRWDGDDFAPVPPSTIDTPAESPLR